MFRNKIILFSVAILLCVSIVVCAHVMNSEKSAVYAKDFSDVKKTDWFYDDVKYVYENKLMNGVNETEFLPSDVATRGMIVTILWRLEGEPIVEGGNFDDVSKDAYYNSAVVWASSNKIVSGYNKTTFGPDDFATREQFAAIMYRYASYKKYDTSKKVEIDKYDDKDQISDYAIECIKWANANNIISGTSANTISPLDNVQRCQVAAILRRFCEAFEFSDDKNPDAGDEEELNTENSTESGTPGGSFGGGSTDVENNPDNSGDDEEIIGAGGILDDTDTDGGDIDNIYEEPERTTLNVNMSFGDPGERVNVIVNVEDNPGILGMILQLEYDEEAMKLVGVKNGDAIRDVLTLTTSKDLKSGVKFVWDGLEISSDQIKDGTILELEFELSENAVCGRRYPMALKYLPGDIIDYDFNSINPLINQGFIEINQMEY